MDYVKIIRNSNGNAFITSSQEVAKHLITFCKTTENFKYIFASQYS